MAHHITVDLFLSDRAMEAVKAFKIPVTQLCCERIHEEIRNRADVEGMIQGLNPINEAARYKREVDRLTAELQYYRKTEANVRYSTLGSDGEILPLPAGH
jgi:hypothetical protein